MTHNIDHHFLEELQGETQQEKEVLDATGGPASTRDPMGWERDYEERMASISKLFEEHKNLAPEEDYEEEFEELMNIFDNAIFYDRAMDAWDAFERMRTNFAYLEMLSRDPWKVKSAIFDKLLPEMERCGEGELAALLAEWGPENVEELDTLLEKSKLYYVLENGGDRETYLSYVDRKSMEDPLFSTYIENLRHTQS